MRDIIGFVPQNDHIMTSYRTVKEVLRFNAKFRLQSNTSNGVIDQTVIGIQYMRLCVRLKI